jgi:hypothetical protein
MIAIMTPNNPRALPKISTTRIFTKRVEFWASESAQLLPTMPTHILQSDKARALKMKVIPRGEHAIEKGDTEEL